MADVVFELLEVIFQNRRHLAPALARTREHVLVKAEVEVWRQARVLFHRREGGAYGEIPVGEGDDLQGRLTIIPVRGIERRDRLRLDALDLNFAPGLHVFYPLKALLHLLQTIAGVHGKLVEHLLGKAQG